MRGFSQSINHKKKTMSFCSFASLLGGACGASSENPNVADFVELKDRTRDVTAQAEVL